MDRTIRALMDDYRRSQEQRPLPLAHPDRPPNGAGQFSLRAWARESFATQEAEILDDVESVIMAYNPAVKDPNRVGRQRLEILVLQRDGTKWRLYPGAKPIRESPDRAQATAALAPAGSVPVSRVDWSREQAVELMSQSAQIADTKPLDYIGLTDALLWAQGMLRRMAEAFEIHGRASGLPVPPREDVAILLDVTNCELFSWPRHVATWPPASQEAVIPPEQRQGHVRRVWLASLGERSLPKRMPGRHPYHSPPAEECWVFHSQWQEDQGPGERFVIVSLNNRPRRFLADAPAPESTFLVWPGPEEHSGQSPLASQPLYGTLWHGWPSWPNPVLETTQHGVNAWRNSEVGRQTVEQAVLALAGSRPKADAAGRPQFQPWPEPAPRHPGGPPLMEDPAAEDAMLAQALALSLLDAPLETGPHAPAPPGLMPPPPRASNALRQERDQEAAEEEADRPKWPSWQEVLAVEAAGMSQDPSASSSETGAPKAPNNSLGGPVAGSRESLSRPPTPEPLPPLPGPPAPCQAPEPLAHPSPPPLPPLPCPPPLSQPPSGPRKPPIVTSASGSIWPDPELLRRGHEALARLAPTNPDAAIAAAATATAAALAQESMAQQVSEHQRPLKMTKGPCPNLNVTFMGEGIGKEKMMTGTRALKTVDGAPQPLFFHQDLEPPPSSLVFLCRTCGVHWDSLGPSSTRGCRCPPGTEVIHLVNRTEVAISRR